MSPLNTLAPDSSEIAMLCGAPSWLSKVSVNGLPALAATREVANWMFLATTVTPLPGGLPAGAGSPVAGAADGPGTAAGRAGGGDGARGRVRCCGCGGGPLTAGY